MNTHSIFQAIWPPIQYGFFMFYICFPVQIQLYLLFTCYKFHMHFVFSFEQIEMKIKRIHFVKHEKFKQFTWVLVTVTVLFHNDNTLDNYFIEK